MLVIKGLSILINLLLIPLTLNYVDSETYGIWLTLSTMVSFISFFDIGINNGLKNKLSFAFAQNDYDLGKKYVSTSYALLTLIFIPLMVFLLLIVPHINWVTLLNLPSAESNSFIVAICIIIGYFCLNFILSTINIILQADQRTAYSSLLQLVQQVISLIIIWFLTITTKGNLLLLCMGLCTSPLVVISIFNITLFHGRYKEISPSLKSVDFILAPSLFKIGVMFFICQIAYVLQIQLINFLIMRFFGGSDVTAYNIAFKYFSILTMIWGILTAPLWTASTDAIAMNEKNWICKMVRKFEKILILFVLMSFIALILSNIVYHVWIGDKVIIPFVLSFWIMLNEISKMIGNLYVTILNGAGLLKTQTLLSLFSPIVFFCTAHILVKQNFGVEAIVIASLLSCFNAYIIAPIQCYKFLYKSI